MRLIPVVASIVLAGCHSTPEPPRANPKERQPALGEFACEFANFRAGNPEAEPAPELPEVYVKITKLDPDAGLVEWKAIHRQGTTLGFREEDGKLTSTHLVFSPKRGKMVKVDFNTGAKLEKIEVDRRVPYEVACCPILDRPMDECPGPAKTKPFVDVTRATYSKPGGGRVLVEKLAGPAMTADELCSIHAGDRDRPKQPPEEAEEARLHPASNLYLDADHLWLSRNPKLRRLAQGTYRTLLAKYADLELVRANKQRVEERANAKLEE